MKEDIFGYISYNYEYGWNIYATKQGNNAENYLKMLIKSKKEMEEKFHSKPLFIQNGMQIGFTEYYIFDCKIKK